MPALTEIALRYVIGLVVLRVLYTLVVQLFGLENLESIQVIIATLPAVDSGMRMMAKATRPLRLSDWLTVWALLTSIFIVLTVIIPAIAFAPMRAAMADPAALAQIITILIAVAVFMALFLVIGSRIRPNRG